MLNKYLYLWQKEIKKEQLKDKKVSEKILDLIGTPIDILEDANYSLGEKSRWNSSTFPFILDKTCHYFWNNVISDIWAAKYGNSLLDSCKKIINGLLK